MYKENDQLLKIYCNTTVVQQVVVYCCKLVSRAPEEEFFILLLPSPLTAAGRVNCSATLVQSRSRSTYSLLVIKAQVSFEGKLQCRGNVVLGEFFSISSPDTS